MDNNYQLVKILEELHWSLTKAVCNEHNDEITPQQRLEHTSLILLVVLFLLFCSCDRAAS
jgi:hypothetical protein